MGESIYVLAFVLPDHALNGWKRYSSAKKVTETNILNSYLGLCYQLNMV